MDDLLHPPVALGAHDDAPVAKRHAVTREARAVRRARRGAAASLPGAARTSRTTSPGDGSGPGLEHERHVRAVPAQLRRKRECERAAAREDDSPSGNDALRLDQ